MTDPSPPRRRIPSPEPLSRLWPRVRPHLGPSRSRRLCLLGSAAISLSFPLIVGKLLDAAFVTRGRELLDRIAILLLGLFTIQAVLNYAQAYLLSATGERAVAGLREELFGKLLSMPPGFFADRRTGELTSRLTTDVGLLQGILSHQIAEFSRQILALVGGIIMLTVSQPKLTLTALAVVPVAVGTAFFFGRRLRSHEHRSAGQDRRGDRRRGGGVAARFERFKASCRSPMSGIAIADRIREVVTRRSAGPDPRHLLRSDHLFRLRRHGGGAVAGWHPGAGWQAHRRRRCSRSCSTPSPSPARSGRSHPSSAATRSRSARRSGCSRCSRRPSPSPTPSTRSAPIVRWRAASPSKSLVPVRDFADAPLGIAQVSLKLEPGEVVAIVGPSGAGKTTLVSLLPRFWDVTEGRILLTGPISAIWRSPICGASSGWCRRSPPCSAVRCGRTSPMRAQMRPGGDRGGGTAAHAREFVERLPAALRDGGRGTGRQALRGPAAADRHRPGDSQGPGRAHSG